MQGIIQWGFLAGALSMSLFAPVAAGQNSGTAAGVTAGKALFDANCAACHRASGAGGIYFGNAVSADLRAPGLETTYHGNTGKTWGKADFFSCADASSSDSSYV